MRFNYMEGKDSNEIIIEEVNVDEFIKVLNNTRLLKYGDDISNEKLNELKNDVEYYKLQYEDALEQIAELEESAEELQACYGEIEKRNDEINEWKQKYENECKHNDVIKKSYDRLAKSFEELVKERDEWKSKWERRKGNVEAFEDLVKQLNDAKYLYEGTTKAYDELHKNFEDTVRELNEYKKVASDRDDLKAKLYGAKNRITTLDCDRMFWKGRWENEFNERVKLKKELEECQLKKES